MTNSNKLKWEQCRPNMWYADQYTITCQGKYGFYRLYGIRGRCIMFDKMETAQDAAQKDYDTKNASDISENYNKLVALITGNMSGMKCKSCNNTGMLHCSDPEYCGGMKPLSFDEVKEALENLIEDAEINMRQRAVEAAYNYKTKFSYSTVIEKEPNEEIQRRIKSLRTTREE